ncbi:unnamed protein product [Diplocarpon coronariae]|nr:hypothetical protein JHW43_008009 [Diplocarpon mali]
MRYTQARASVSSRSRVGRVDPKHITEARVDFYWRGGGYELAGRAHHATVSQIHAPLSGSVRHEKSYEREGNAAEHSPTSDGMQRRAFGREHAQCIAVAAGFDDTGRARGRSIEHGNMKAPNLDLRVRNASDGGLRKGQSNHRQSRGGRNGM